MLDNQNLWNCVKTTLSVEDKHENLDIYQWLLGKQENVTTESITGAETHKTELRYEHLTWI